MIQKVKVIVDFIKLYSVNILVSLKHPTPSQLVRAMTNSSATIPIVKPFRDTNS